MDLPPPHNGFSRGLRPLAKEATPHVPWDCPSPNETLGDDAGDSKGGRAPPFVSSRKRGSRGRNPIERVSPPVRCFGYFLSAQEVTRGTGPEAPKRQRVAEQPALCSYFTSPNSAQVLLSVIKTSAYRPMREASPRRWTSRPPLVRLERGQRASPLSPSTSTRTVWPT